MQNLINTVIWAKKPGTETLIEYKLVEIVKSQFLEEIFIVQEIKEIDGRRALMPVLDIYIDDTLNHQNKV